MPMVLLLFLIVVQHLVTSFITLPRIYISTISSTAIYSSSSTARSSTLGAPSSRPKNGVYISKGGVSISSKVIPLEDSVSEIDFLINSLDDHNGVLLTSSYEYPGRYSRWTVGFQGPPICIEGTGMNFTIRALNSRGSIICKIIYRELQSKSTLFMINDIQSNGTFEGSIIKIGNQYFPEEERSKQPSLFTLVRTIRDLFTDDSISFQSYGQQLGLYGAFGYDLTFQFEPIALSKPRDSSQRDLLLYLPDEVIVVDNQKKDAWRIQYNFTDESKQLTTESLPRHSFESKYSASTSHTPILRRNEKGSFASRVDRAKQEFKVGNLFEVVLSQLFREKMPDDVLPSTIFRRLCRRNPSPYGFFINLGRNEYLVGASPEMFVRVEPIFPNDPNDSNGSNDFNKPSSLSGGSDMMWRVETCPISGTIERGTDPLEDARQIMKLLSSKKEESELTMCTDVDRNDKSRICIPGTVRVLGRRQIELYSRLIHTVDHVEGYLLSKYDALDAFLCHTWAVTVTGAPKTWAIRFIEQMEGTVRHWYGGAVGIIGFDGSMNTGLTLRTVRIKDGIAEVRAGATLLHDSESVAEEAETELKASALLDAILRPDSIESVVTSKDPTESFDDHPIAAIQSKKVLLIDHEDSFVHTLANYFRQIGQPGAEVVTCRSGPAFTEFLMQQIDTKNFTPDLCVLSPGPGSPSDFHLSKTIEAMIQRKIPIFGVCLGLQGLVEYFGGELAVLDYPMHGKPSVISRTYHDSPIQNQPVIETDILRDLPTEFQVARYHSLHGRTESLPDSLMVTALSSDGIIMAIQHKSMPIAAVQFHPESILTLPKHGMKILQNALGELKPNMYDD